MERGRVLWFSHEKGFGVIETDDGGRLMVDHTEIRDNGSANGHSGNGGRPEFQTLERGVPVEYEIVKGSRGRLRAAEVRTSGG